MKKLIVAFLVLTLLLAFAAPAFAHAPACNGLLAANDAFHRAGKTNTHGHDVVHQLLVANNCLH
jgi:hypothetical protein